MGIVIGYSDLIAEAMPPADVNLRRIIKIKDAAQRATALIRQLLAFSRLQVFAPNLMDLNVSISHLAEMLPRLLGEDIRLMLSLDPELWTVKADPSQIDQVLMNLSVNARDAMPHGGKLVIETHNVELDESCASAHPGVPPGPFAVICVSDTGTGISSEVMPRIFDPFFTTKEMGKGTGLGLSTVYGIVRQSGHQSTGRYDLQNIPAEPEWTGPCDPSQESEYATQDGGLENDSAGRGRLCLAGDCKYPVGRIGLHRARGQQRSGSHPHGRKTRRANRSAAYRCGDARHERPPTGR
jgi:hypothetical protein